MGRMALPDPATLSPTELDALRTVPAAEFARLARQRDPKASGKAIAAWAAHPVLNRGEVTKAAAQAVIAASKASPEPPRAAPGFAGFMPAADRPVQEAAAGAKAAAERGAIAILHERFLAALTTNDARAAAQYAALLKAHFGEGALAALEARDGADGDWARASDAMVSCAGYIMRVIGSMPASEADAAEDAWWAALFARVPGHPLARHPAHVPLPAGSPLPTIAAPAGDDGKPARSRGYFAGPGGH
jgi:hypothetical protein